MPIIIPRREVWTKQPKQAVSINWSNSLTKNLVGVFYPTEINSGLVNAVDRSFVLGTVGTVATVPDKFGFGTNHNGGENFFTKATALLSAPPFSVIVVAKYSGDGVLFSFANLSTSNNSSSIDISSGQLRCNSYGGSFSSSTYTAKTFSSGEYFTGAGVWESSTKRTAYVNGLPATANTASNSPSVNNTNIGSLYRSGTHVPFNGVIFLTCIFNRALSDLDVKYISDNIWQIFQP